jgi:NAD+ synthase
MGTNKEKSMEIVPTIEDCINERDRIISFLDKHLPPPTKAVVAVSGGVDSDLTARLVVASIGSVRTKLFTVVQQDMELRHLNNARQLASDLGVPLVELHLADLPFQFIRQMMKDDPIEDFRPTGLLDPARAKCSMRTVVLSTYQDRGYVVVGSSNRTELMTGFFLPFGDALCHLAPIIHLYKSQVRALAAASGTQSTVLNQPASAGFWEGQEDLEDLSWWLYCRSPISVERSFDKKDESKAKEIRACLTTQALDLALVAIDEGYENSLVTQISGLPVDVSSRLRSIYEAALENKRRPLGVGLENINAG